MDNNNEVFYLIIQLMTLAAFGAVAVILYVENKRGPFLGLRDRRKDLLFSKDTFVITDKMRQNAKEINEFFAEEIPKLKEELRILENTSPLRACNNNQHYGSPACAKGD
jgi:hypothetical protein